MVMGNGDGDGNGDAASATASATASAAASVDVGRFKIEPGHGFTFSVPASGKISRKLVSKPNSREQLQLKNKH